MANHCLLLIIQVTFDLEYLRNLEYSDDYAFLKLNHAYIRKPQMSVSLTAWVSTHCLLLHIDYRVDTCSIFILSWLTLYLTRREWCNSIKNGIDMIILCSCDCNLSVLLITGNSYLWRIKIMGSRKWFTLHYKVLQ